MTTTHRLYEAGGTFSTSAAESIARTRANAFASTAGGFVVGLGFYRSGAGMTGPAALQLWDTSTGTAVATLTTLLDGGSAGWQWTPLPAAVALVSAREYRVSITTSAGGTFPQNTTVSTRPTAPSPLIFSDHKLYFANAASTFPTTTAETEYDGSDVWWNDDGSAMPSAPGGGVPAPSDLADWLDTSVGTQPHSAPLQDHPNVTTIRQVVGSTTGQLDATKAVADAIHDLLTATNKNLGTLWDLAGHLADLEIAAWQHFFGAGEQRLTGPNSAGGSAFYTADGDLVSQLVAETWQRVRVLRGDIGFGTDGWTMTAEEGFEDAIAFVQPADAYTLHVTSYQPTQPANTSPAGLWLPRIGWWCILTGAHASQRQFVDFEQQLLSDQGHRMPGAAIQLKPGTLATVQAWVLA